MTAQTLATFIAMGVNFALHTLTTYSKARLRGWAWLRGRETPWRRDADGRVVSAIGHVLDVTDRHDAEEQLAATARALRSDRERLSVALRAGGFGVHAWTEDEKTLWWSPEMYPLFGVDPDTFVPTPASFDAMLHPDDRKEMRRAHAAWLVDGGAFVHEYRIRRPDGAVRWMVSRSQSVLDARGRIERTVGVTADVTERRLALDALRLAEERLRLALAGANAGVWQVTFEPHGVFWSDEYRRVFGIPADEPVTDAGWARRVHPDDLPSVYACIDAMRSGRSDGWTVEYRIRHDTLGERWIQDHVRVQRDTAGRVRSFGGVVLDVTERRGIEQSLRDADRRKDEFLAVLAHELRNPLAPLRTALKLLDYEALSDRGRTATAMGRRQVAQLARLVDDLLDVSRITRGRIELRPEPLGLHEVIREVAAGQSAAVAERGQRLSLHLPDPAPALRADPVRVAQIVDNLLTNASKYTDRGGAIDVSALGDGDAEVLIEVRDTGIGIDAADLPRLFEPFSQLRGSAERSQGGLGLGLALVRQLAHLHGGRVAADSPGVGLGATFRVWLPCNGPDATGTSPD
jgi:PAS domain S-box-containing protein